MFELTDFHVTSRSCGSLRRRTARRWPARESSRRLVMARPPSFRRLTMVTAIARRTRHSCPAQRHRSDRQAAACHHRWRNHRAQSGVPLTVTESVQSAAQACVGTVTIAPPSATASSAGHRVATLDAWRALATRGGRPFIVALLPREHREQEGAVAAQQHQADRTGRPGDEVARLRYDEHHPLCLGDGVDLGRALRWRRRAASADAGCPARRRSRGGGSPGCRRVDHRDDVVHTQLGGRHRPRQRQVAGRDRRRHRAGPEHEECTPPETVRTPSSRQTRRAPLRQSTAAHEPVASGDVRGPGERERSRSRSCPAALSTRPRRR